MTCLSEAALLSKAPTRETPYTAEDNPMPPRNAVKSDEDNQSAAKAAKREKAALSGISPFTCFLIEAQ